MAPLPWHIWPGRGWPLSAEDEDAFVRALRRHVPDDARRPKFDRATSIYLSTALRSGADVEAMFELARGLRAVSLLVAYDRFDSLLAEARSCYDQLFDDLPDDPPTQAEIVDGLAPLTPTAAARLRQAVGDTPRLADVAKQIDERVRDLWGKSDDIAAAIEKAAAADRTERAVELGCLLFNPSAGDYLWSHPLWVPRRVTELTPLQITDLIGEKRDEKNLL